MSARHATQGLTNADVAHLLSDPSETIRAETASKIAAQFESGRLSDTERELAEQIFRVMVQDAALRVREALSHHLKACPFLPHDVAVTLAKDVDSVALPILEASDVLTDVDLLEIISSQNVEKQLAITRRKRVSEVVSEALVETGEEAVVISLVGNKGAELSEGTLHKVLDTYGEIEAVQAPIVKRVKLPVAISERLVTLVTDNLREQLITKHDLPVSAASDLVMQARERATLALLDPDAGELSAETLVYQLHEHDRLTPSIILRAACTGDMDFFVASMAIRVGIPIPNAYQLIFDKGYLGLKAIYQRSGLPENLYPAFRVAVDVANETQYDGEDFDRERYNRRIIERILTQYENLRSDDIEYLLGRLTKIGDKVEAVAAGA
ncbi:MAG: DUF2336 domain-containing protein [Alphaproteobacteria bacterium]|nr:DUF2336 domain-containing protein [Alphaproteobacteria bacterium]